MFTDLKGSTQLAVKLGDEKAMHLLRVHNALTREALSAHHGREVKTTGDGFLLSFAEAGEALRCAVASQEAFAGYNDRNPEEELQVRIGVAAGEPIEEAGDLYGAAVNLASRICDSASAGGILIAQVVHDIDTGTGKIGRVISQYEKAVGQDEPDQQRVGCDGKKDIGQGRIESHRAAGNEKNVPERSNGQDLHRGKDHQQKREPGQPMAGGPPKLFPERGPIPMPVDGVPAC